MRERDIEAYLVAGCRHVGALCYKWTSPGRVGVPDRICVFPSGRIVFVELKAPGRKPSPAQLREHARLREYKQTVVVVDSIEGVEDIMLWAKDHDRDLNAALNLKRLATETALPVASPSGNGGAAAGMVPAAVGKVTPVRYECGHQDPSGQEENRAHFCALS